MCGNQANVIALYAARAYIVKIRSISTKCSKSNYTSQNHAMWDGGFALHLQHGRDCKSCHFPTCMPSTRATASYPAYLPSVPLVRWSHFPCTMQPMIDIDQLACRNRPPKQTVKWSSRWSFQF